ncbi:CheA signal transduction histidine kinase [Clostridium sp. DL-VIII]|uniref:chemotaxis protein CheA n=1 Tax=Clostridium sp. DL-VIII TaxID=641107 RepID=UPI00023AFAD9|nr:chemotaxis protein CheA [Clostridium sp. DL-VIII]EHJ00686.1 CheA signal transduction histidine kinase [Clostridium sp. DL-VIII]
MSDNFSQEPMLLDIYIFETTQLIEQLEQVIINNEKAGSFTIEAINEVFRIMHTIKGSSAMMMFNNITTVSHSIEDLFYFLRENKPENTDYSRLSDIVLDGIDFIKTEVDKVIEKKNPDGDASELILDIKKFLEELKGNNESSEERVINEKIIESINETENLIDIEMIKDLGKNSFKAKVYFEEGCEMEDIRAFGIVNSMQELSENIHHIPKELFGDDNCVETIRKDGFIISFTTDREYDEVRKFLAETILVRDVELTEVKDDNESNKASENTLEVKEISEDLKSKSDKEYLENKKVLDSHKISENQKVTEAVSKDKKDGKTDKKSGSSHQSIISVNVSKLDMLMDMIGELVISEAMVIQNPDLKGLNLGNFQKASRQLEKITGELQDIVMSIRMVPLVATFQKMNRIVRDMSKKLSKEVKLKIIGEDTEVDKNIIEHISDPLMHLVRNSIDHGLESPEERIAKGKPEIGTITLEAKNEGGDVFIIVRDDGKGLKREKLLTKARENGLINRPEEDITDKEVFSFIFLPGFSTKEKVTEFSGRGVGMDVVAKNIGSVGGIISVDSAPNIGTTMTLKIPLTLAIMDGMIIKVGKASYTIPIKSIKESFRAKEEEIITDPDGNEMIMIRGKCYPILRLHSLHKLKTEVENIPDGIIIMVSSDDKSLCIFADELIGQQQVVVKALPEYIKKFNKTNNGLSGCTLLGDGSISLILDVAELVKY